MSGVVKRAMLRLLRSGLHKPCSRWHQLNKNLGQIRFYSLYEPDGLDRKPDIPEYEILNIRMRGYDYPILESFSKYVHSLVMNLDLDSDSFAVPARTSHVQVYKPNSSNVDSTYDLAVFERTVQIEDLPSTLAPILLDVIQQNLPEGVQFTVKEPDAEEEDFRYVPDIMLLELQSQIEDLDLEREKRKK